MKKQFEDIYVICAQVVANSVFSIQYSLREIICVLAEISAVVLWLMKSVLRKGNEDNMLRIIFVS